MVVQVGQTVYGVRGGLNLDELEVTTDDEIDQQLTRARKDRGVLDPGPLYAMTSSSGIILGAYVEQPKTIDWPEGWAPDMAAFRCGLDESTRLLTDHDKCAIEEWFARAIGEVPRWVTWLASHDPTPLKAYRGRWERTFGGALPKQMMPYLSIRHITVMGDRDGLREAVLPGKAWGMTHDYIVNTIAQSAHYYCGVERLNMVDEVLQDVL